MPRKKLRSPEELRRIYRAITRAIENGTKQSQACLRHEIAPSQYSHWFKKYGHTMKKGQKPAKVQHSVFPLRNPADSALSDAHSAVTAGNLRISGDGRELARFLRELSSQFGGHA